jgi:hypothetical protein
VVTAKAAAKAAKVAARATRASKARDRRPLTKLKNLEGGPDLFWGVRGCVRSGPLLSLGIRAAPILLLCPFQQHHLISNAALQSFAGMANALQSALD